jgi:hypothetical protein
MVTPRGELERMTATKLREMAISSYPTITGASGMKKEDLVEAIIQEDVRQGRRPKEDAHQKARADMGVGQLKAAIRRFKAQRDTALEKKDHAATGSARLAIKRMKRQLRKVRETA